MWSGRSFSLVTQPGVLGVSVKGSRVHAGGLHEGVDAQLEVGEQAGQGWFADALLLAESVLQGLE